MSDDDDWENMLDSDEDFEIEKEGDAKTFKEEEIVSKVKLDDVTESKTKTQARNIAK